MPGSKDFVFSFGEREVAGWLWFAHYKGNLVYPEDITFRFWGSADDILVIMVDDKVILNASRTSSQDQVSSRWKSTAPDNRTHRMGNSYTEGSEWITLEAGKPRSMQVLIGEVPGGHFDCMLTVQVKGEDYPMNKWGGPIYPMFTTEVPSHNLLDQIIPKLVPGEASLTNGPVFKDY